MIPIYGSYSTPDLICASSCKFNNMCLFHECYIERLIGLFLCSLRKIYGDIGTGFSVLFYLPMTFFQFVEIRLNSFCVIERDLISDVKIAIVKMSAYIVWYVRSIDRLFRHKYNACVCSSTYVSCVCISPTSVYDKRDALYRNKNDTVKIHNKVQSSRVPCHLVNNYANS